MIMIIGSSHDDILYFESIMTGKREEKVFDYPLTIGSIFNQEVLLVDSVYTNPLSSAITSALIAKYYVILVFVVGKAIAFSSDWKAGDIAISRQIYFGDVDQSADTDARFGQIPGLPPYFQTQEDVLGYVTSSFEKRMFGAYYPATFVSSNVVFTLKKQLVEVVVDDTIFGHQDRVVLDSNSGGVALACHLSRIPFVSIKVISRFLDQPYTVEDYASTLRRYVDLGRGIVSTIGDIGRSDLLGGN